MKTGGEQAIMRGKRSGMATVSKMVFAGLLLAVSSAATAQFSGSVAATTDYDYRGYSQTAGDMAIQGSIAYEHESGFYGSIWGSTLDWGSGSDADIEVDYVVGFTSDFGDSGVSWDVGFLYYDYPGLSSADFLEIYGGLSWSLFHVKLSYSDDFAGLGASAWYLDGGVSYDWDNGVGVFAYAGYSFGDAFDNSNDGYPFGAPDYYNYGFGAAYTVAERITFDLRAVGTNQDGIYKVEDGVFENDFRGLASVTISFP
jgi:uncharacterized protein (TIGR02001 family)